MFPSAWSLLMFPQLGEATVDVAYEPEDSFPARLPIWMDETIWLSTGIPCGINDIDNVPLH